MSAACRFHETHYQGKRPDWSQVLRTTFGSAELAADHVTVADVLSLYDADTGRLWLADEPVPTAGGQPAPTEGAALFLLATAQLQPEDTLPGLVRREQQRRSRKRKLTTLSPERKVQLIGTIFSGLRHRPEQAARMPLMAAKLQRAEDGAASPFTGAHLRRCLAMPDAPPIMHELARLQPEPDEAD